MAASNQAAWNEHKMYTWNEIIFAQSDYKSMTMMILAAVAAATSTSLSNDYDVDNKRKNIVLSFGAAVSLCVRFFFSITLFVLSFSFSCHNLMQKFCKNSKQHKHAQAHTELKVYFRPTDRSILYQFDNGDRITNTKNRKKRNAEEGENKTRKFFHRWQKNPWKSVQSRNKMKKRENAREMGRESAKCEAKNCNTFS